ncbi:hypothetical protein ACOSQ2_011992 [Xanthoceras sorbifolium]
MEAKLHWSIFLFIFVLFSFSRINEARLLRHGANRSITASFFFFGIDGARLLHHEADEVHQNRSLHLPIIFFFLSLLFLELMAFLFYFMFLELMELVCSIM